MLHHGHTTDIMPMTAEGRELPRFTLRETDLPQVRDWQVGGKYFLIMEVEQTAQRSSKDLEATEGSGRVKIEGDFMVLSIKVPDDKSQSKLESQAFENALAKARSGTK